MMTTTRKLYWADAYRRSFTARVMRRHNGERPIIMLNRTLFYPTGGGQPHDTGSLGDARVLAVEQVQEGIQHFVDHLPDDDVVTCEIDWARRWDHMQQHSGQHLLSAGFLDLLNRPTIGFHLSQDSVTIDIEGPPPQPSEIDEVLAFTQTVMDENRPILSYFVSPFEASQLPLRKAPTVEGTVRVVEIAGTDWSACGGTHVQSTAAIGSIVITRLERRANDTRVYFLCGKRASEDHQDRIAVTQQLGEHLTTGLAEMPAAVLRLQSNLSQAQKDIRLAQSQMEDMLVQQLWSDARVIADVRVVERTANSEDPKSANRIVSKLLDRGGCVVIQGLSGNQPRWMAGCSTDVQLDLTHALTAVLALSGVKGGGKPGLVQGGVPDNDTLEQVLQILQSEIIQSLNNNLQEANVRYAVNQGSQVATAGDHS